MSNQQIALRLALEALEGSISVSMANIALRHKAITVIKEALAQPEHPEQMAQLGWQYVECPACGAEGARAFPKPDGMHHNKPYRLLQDIGSKYFGLSWDKAEQPAQQEPFGYFKAEPFGWTDCGEADEGAVALYERPPARKPLTDEQIKDAVRGAGLSFTAPDFKVARAIEAAHGIMRCNRDAPQVGVIRGRDT